MTRDSAHIYAEHLVHLRQVSVSVTLPAQSNARTHASLGKDGLSFTVQYDDEVTSLSLPCPVIWMPIIPPQTPLKELSFRFKCEASDGDRLANFDPWTASTLHPGLSVACQSCGHQLVESVQQWKDLPSGGWADMMELWHCHKPDVLSSNGYDAAHKGYAASSALTPMPRCGLVDVSSLSFSAEDCIGIEVSKLVLNYGVIQICIPPFGVCMTRAYWATRRWPVSKILMAEPPIQSP